ncbi:MAG: von Willebrand factor type A domain-containing protein [Roseibacillus sp.]|nr:von Willebrand factor type A domain-containing protein [Roseibacillus sp.]
MNDDKYSGDRHAWIEPETEARVVSLILGEASDFEVDELELMMEERPEIRAFKRRLESLDGLLWATLAPSDDEDWKLAPERKRDLLEAIELADPSEEVPVLEGDADRVRERRIRRAGRRVLWSAAACFAVALFLVAFFARPRMGADAELSSRGEGKDGASLRKGESKNLSGGVKNWGRDQAESAKFSNSADAPKDTVRFVERPAAGGEGDRDEAHVALARLNETLMSEERTLAREVVTGIQGVPSAKPGVEVDAGALPEYATRQVRESTDRAVDKKSNFDREFNQVAGRVAPLPAPETALAPESFPETPASPIPVPPRAPVSAAIPAPAQDPATGAEDDQPAVPGEVASRPVTSVPRPSAEPAAEESVEGIWRGFASGRPVPRKGEKNGRDSRVGLGIEELKGKKRLARQVLEKEAEGEIAQFTGVAVEEGIGGGGGIGSSEGRSSGSTSDYELADRYQKSQADGESKQSGGPEVRGGRNRYQLADEESWADANGKLGWVQQGQGQGTGQSEGKGQDHGKGGFGTETRGREKGEREEDGEGGARPLDFSDPFAKAPASKSSPANERAKSFSAESSELEENAPVGSGEERQLPHSRTSSKSKISPGFKSAVRTASEESAPVDPAARPAATRSESLEAAGLSSPAGPEAYRFAYDEARARMLAEADKAWGMAVPPPVGLDGNARKAPGGKRADEELMSSQDPFGALALGEHDDASADVGGRRMEDRFRGIRERKAHQDQVEGRDTAKFYQDGGTAGDRVVQNAKKDEEWYLRPAPDSPPLPGTGANRTDASFDVGQQAAERAEKGKAAGEEVGDSLKGREVALFKLLEGQLHDETELLADERGPVVTEARRRTEEKLRRIVFPKVELDGISLNEAVEFLEEQTRAHDYTVNKPDGEKLRYGILHESAPGDDFEVDGKEDGRKGAANPGDTLIKGLRLENVPVERALASIAEQAEMSVRIDDDGAVLFVPLAGEAVKNIELRTWEIPLVAWEKIQNGQASANGRVVARDLLGIPATTSPAPPAKEALMKYGIEFPEGSSVTYENVTGTFAAKNTSGNLALIDKVVQDSLQRISLEQEALKAFEKSAGAEPKSTFSLNVSDVSFKLAKASLAKGEWPPADQVRTEEFVNNFDYGDPAPSQDERVACHIEQAAHPFLQQRNLMRVSMSTAAQGRAVGVPLRLTVLLDNSGSMDRTDRVESVQNAFRLLASQLTKDDRVTLVSFARTSRLLADRVAGDEVVKLVDLVEGTPSEGGTNLEQALKLGMAKAREQKLEGGQNRIILLTDGAANLGNAKPAELAKMVENMRQQGIAFDACGVGAEGYNDEILESLTRKGDGRYYFLDRPEDADGGFAEQIAGALRPAARNVKVQVNFNPKRVGRYKLYGFEKHRLKKEDFRNDSIDAAELASEEAGNAIYQVEVLPEGEGDLGTVSVRFQDTASGEMVEREWAIPYQPQAPYLEQAPASLRLAAGAALLGEKLKGSLIGEVVEMPRLGKIINSLPAAYPSDPRVKDIVEMANKVRELGGE